MRITLLGGHASGKTSYLGALWATVRSAAPGAAVTLDEGRLPSNSTYLDECEYALLAGDPVERTKLDHAERIDLELLIDGASVKVTHLDVAGETYEAALEQRLAAPSLISELSQTESVMLFVHPGRIRLPSSILEANRYISAVGGDVSAALGADLGSEASEVDPANVWNRAPTAVHLVELLQMVMSHRNASGRLKVALIVSAWDTLDKGPNWGSSVRPDLWVSQNLSLLDQFMRANSGTIQWQAFGVSAQGCDFEDRDAVDLIVEEPYEQRTIVATGGCWTHDIAEPIRWFLSEQVN